MRETRFRVILSLTVCMLWSTLAYAQESDVTNLQADDYLQISLPSLSTLFENAKNNSTTAFYAKQKEIAQSELSSEKRNWLKNLKIFTSYQYGVVDLNSSFSDNNTPLFSQYRGNKQSWYNVGVSLSIPFDEIFDRGNRIKRKKKEIESVEIESERSNEDLKLRIIEMYTETLKYLTLLKSKSEALTLANAQYRLTEYDFVNGKITVQELDRQKEIQTTSIAEYEEIRSQLNKSLLMLEVLSKTVIIK